MAIVTQTAVSGDSSVTFTIDDSVPEVVRIEITAGSRPVTASLLNDDGSVKASITVPAGTTQGANLTPPQRRRATLVEHPRNPGVFILSFPHRIEF